MTLTKRTLKGLLEEIDIRNIDGKFSENDVVGVSTAKSMIETKANLDGVSLLPYKLFPPKSFAYVADTSRRGEKIALAYNNTEKTYIVSTWYVVFKIKEEAQKLISSDYLFMFFNRNEFDRYTRVNSWGSAREYFWLNDMEDVEIELPSLSIQQKYVDVYNSMLANQKSYERGLEDLKLVCDAYIEDLRKKYPCEEIGPYIDTVNEPNTERKVTFVQGVESSGSFIDTRANMQDVDIANYTVVSKENIAYNPSRINLGSIALYSEDNPCIVSPMYSVFKIIDDNKIIPEYLMLWFSRTEFHRYTWFYAAGSVRDTFDFNLMKEVKFPIPSIEIQKSIVEIYNAYNTRKSINEKLKSQIKDICPVLIKGSIEEAK